FPGGRLPEVDRPDSSGRRQNSAVRGEGHGTEEGAMVSARTDFLARRHIMNANTAACGGKPLAVGRERDAVDPAVGALDLSHFVTRDGIPQTYRGVPAAGSEVAPVGGRGHAANVFLVTVQEALLSCGGVPQTDGRIRGRSQQLAVRGEGDRRNAERV